MYRRIPRSSARQVLPRQPPREIIDKRRRGMNGPTWFRRDQKNRKRYRAPGSLAVGAPAARPASAEAPDGRMAKDEQAAQERRFEYRLALKRGIHVGRFVRWVEGGNAQPGTSRAESKSGIYKRTKRMQQRALPTVRMQW
jgi:asparagine synthase (glutamine-hydrolysing)